MKHEPTISSHDPEAYGTAESYMKVCQKICHIALIENNNPKAKIGSKQFVRPLIPVLERFLQKKFNRKFHNRLPSLNKPSDHEEIKEAHQHEAKQKKKQKAYKYNKSYIKPRKIKEGDTVLLRKIHCFTHNTTPLLIYKDIKLKHCVTEEEKQGTPRCERKFSLVNTEGNRDIFAA